MRRIDLATCVLLTLACAWAGPVLAQSDRGSLTGRITDGTGGILPGVTVTATNQNTSEVREVTTNEEGLYTLAELKAAPYRVRAELPGFRVKEVADVRIAVQIVRTLDIILDLGDMTEVVTVASRAPVIQTQSAVNQTNVTERQVQELPLLVTSESGGRTPLAFLFLDSSITSGQGQAGTNASVFRVQGGQALGTEILIDGAATRRAQNGTFFSEVAPGPNAFQEFTVSTSSYSAEYGNSSGGVVNFTLKSGTNELHGEAYEFLRHDKLNANSMLRKSDPDPEVRDHPARDRQHNFGVNAGGPISIPGLFRGNDRAFWFLNYEGYRFNRSEQVSITVPTERMRRGDFSELFTDPDVLAQFPGGVQVYDPTQPRDSRAPIPANRIDLYQGGRILDPVGLAILNEFPVPTRPGVFRNYTASSEAPTEMNNFVGKVDLNLTSRQHMAVSYSYRKIGGFKGGFPRFETPLDTGTLVAAGVWDQAFKSHFARLQHNYTFGSSALNHLNVGFTRYDVANSNTTYGFDNTTLGFRPTSTARQAFPLIGFPGYGDPATSSNVRAYQGIGSTFFHDQLTDNAFQLTDYVTLVRGRHTFKVGADLRWQAFDVFQRIHPGGEFNFRHDQTASGSDPDGGWPIASLITGATEFSFNSVQSIDPGWRQFSHSYFINDDLKVSPNLVVNVGLRYDLPGLRTEVEDRFRGFDPEATNPVTDTPGALVSAGGSRSLRADHRTLAGADRSNFAPRLGFAYTFNPKTVLRGGFGLYYAPIIYGYGGANTLTEGTMGYNTLGGPNFTAEGNPDLFLRNYRDVPENDPTGQFIGADVDFFDPDFRTGRTAQYSLDVQRELPWNLALTVGYLGHRGSRLRSDFGRLNALPLDALELGFPLLTKPLADVTPAERAYAVLVGVPLPANPSAVYEGFAGSVAQSLRPFPQYGFIRNQLESRGKSTYHALNLKLDRRFSQGVQFMLSYTLSRLTTNAAEDLFGGSPLGGVLQNPYDLESLDVLSPNSLTHVGVLSYILELPFGEGKRYLNNKGFLARVLGGWQLSGVHRYQSGLPFAPRLRGNPAFLDVFGVRGELRPNLTDEPIFTDETPEGVRFPYVNRDAFEAPPDYTAPPTTDVRNPAYRAFYADPNRFFGTAPPVLSDVRAPAFLREDLSLIKKTRINEDVAVELRAEMFNAFNRHTYFLPSNNLSEGDFGVSLVNHDPRTIQLGLRVIF